MNPLGDMDPENFRKMRKEKNTSVNNLVSIGSICENTNFKHTKQALEYRHGNILLQLADPDSTFVITSVEIIPTIACSNNFLSKNG